MIGIYVAIIALLVVAIMVAGTRLLDKLSIIQRIKLAEKIRFEEEDLQNKLGTSDLSASAAKKYLKKFMDCYNTINESSIRNTYRERGTSKIRIKEIKADRIYGEINLPEVPVRISFFIYDDGGLILLNYEGSSTSSRDEKFNNFSYLASDVSNLIFAELKIIDPILTQEIENKESESNLIKNQVSELLKKELIEQRRREALKIFKDDPELLALANEIHNNAESLSKVKEKTKELGK